MPPTLSVLTVETPAEIRAAYGLEAEACRMPDHAVAWDRWLLNFAPATEAAEVVSAPIIYTSGTTGRPKGVRREKMSGKSTKAFAGLRS